MNTDYEGKVVTAIMPQTNDKTKVRPGIVLKRLPGYGDFLICGISSKLNQYISGFDEIIKSSDSDFGETGLVQDSIIRLSHIRVISRNSIGEVIGKIKKERYDSLLQNLSLYIYNGQDQE